MEEKLEKTRAELEKAGFPVSLPERSWNSRGATFLIRKNEKQRPFIRLLIRKSGR